jgi:glycosyltransferase involved in cell wall biosynthesis
MNISFIILTYNQENYIREALNAVLLQKCQPLEIIVSDDCSIDNTCTLIQDILNNYKGEHSVFFNRNKVNLGIAKHFNKVISEFCHGDIILTADGDDISFPERTQRTIDLFAENPEIMGLSFEKILVDKYGNITNGQIIDKVEYRKLNFKDYINSGEITFCGSSRAFRRQVMDFFGPLKYSDGNDIFVFNRCLMLGGYLYSNEKMIFYRLHDYNTDQPKGYTKKIIMQAKQQLLADLEFAVEKGLVTKQDAESAINKRIKPILRKFWERHYSYYNPTLYLLILWRSKIKKSLRKLTMKTIHAFTAFHK